mgnify:CR=1 FL=1
MKETLAHGPVAAKEIKKQARRAGIAEITLRRAKRELGVRVRRVGEREGEWQWVKDDHPPAKDVHFPKSISMSIFKNVPDSLNDKASSPSVKDAHMSIFKEEGQPLEPQRISGEFKDAHKVSLERSHEYEYLKKPSKDDWEVFEI